MSTEIDSKVVELKFNNRDFEENVQTSLTTLEKLKAALKFGDVSKSFDAIEKASSDVSMSAISKATEEVSLKFNALEVAAVTALGNITNSAVNTGIQLIKSLSTDNMAAGWQKFGEKTTSVGTLIAQGFDMDVVSDQLEQLNWYTDETSYKFTDMVSNIAKFTATGQDLESSVEAMQGIANWAALSGQNANVAARAMYNLSQAMGVGALKLIDYKSIQNASMDTAEFRQKTLEAAVELGTLKRVADDTYETLNGKQFTKQSFTSQLAVGWLDKDVMTKVFNEYGAAVGEIQQRTEETGQTATDVIRSITKLAEEENISIDEAIKKMGFSFDEFALKAFKAAQEARTWQDVLDATKEAVASGWMNTFENIFGDYEEAKDLWSQLANELYDVFAEGGNKRNEMLSEWKELGGRQTILDAFWNSYYALTDAVNLVKEAFQEAFPPMTAKRLLELTTIVRDLTEKFKMSDENAEHLKNVLADFFTLIRIGVDTVKSLIRGLTPLLDLFKTNENGLEDLDNKFSEFVDTLTLCIERYHVFEEITYRVGSAVSELVGYFRALLENNLDDFLTGAKKNGSIFEGLLYTIGGNIGNIIRLLFNLASAVTGIDLSDIRDKVLGTFAGMWISLSDLLMPIIGKVKSYFGTIKNTISGFFSSVMNINSFDDFVNLLKSIISSFHNFIGSLNLSGGGKTAVSGIKFIFESIANLFRDPVWANIAEFIKGGGLILIGTGIYEFVEELAAIRKAIGFGEVLGGVVDILEEYQKQIRSKTILNIAEAIMLLAISLVMLSKVPTHDLATALIGLAAVFTGLMLTLSKMEVMLSAKNIESITSISLAILMMGGSLLLIAMVIDKLKDIPAEQIGKGLLSVALSITILGVAAFALRNTAPFAINAAKAMIPMAVAMNLLILPLKILGALNMEYISRGIAALAGSLFTMTLSLMGLSLVADGLSKVNMIKVAGGLLSFALVINLLVPPLLALAAISATTHALGPAVGALCAALGTLALALMGLSVVTQAVNPGSMLATSVAMIAIAAALNMLLLPIQVLGSMDADTRFMGIDVLVGLLSGLVLVMIGLSQVSPMALVAAGSFVLVVQALTALLVPIELLGHMDIDVLNQGLLYLGGVLAVMIIALWGLSMCSTQVIAAAAALAVLSGAFILMAAAVDILIPAVIEFGQNMNKNDARDGLLAVAGLLLGMTGIAVLGIGLLALLTKVMAPSIPVLLGAAGALTLFALAIGALIAPLLLLTATGSEFALSFVETITIFADNMAVIVEDLKVFTAAIAKIIPELLGALLVGFLEGLNDWLGPLLDVVLAIVIAILEAIKNKIGELVEILIDIILEVIEAIANKAADIVQAFVDVVIAIIDAVADVIVAPETIQRFKQSFEHLFENWWESFKEFWGIHSPSDKTEWFGQMLIEGLENGVKSAWEKLWSGITNVGEKVRSFVDEYVRGFPEIFKMGMETVKGYMTKGFDEIRTGIKSAGENFVNGFKDGIIEKKDKVVEAVTGMGNGALDILKDIFQIHSPAEKLKEIAEMVGLGFTDGIEGMGSKVKEAVSGFGNNALSGLSGMYDMFFDSGKNSGLSFINGWETSFRMITGKMSKEQHMAGADYYIEQGEQAREYMIRQSQESIDQAADEVTGGLSDATADVLNGALTDEASLKAALDEIDIQYNLGLIATEEEYHKQRLAILLRYQGEWTKTTSAWLKKEKDWFAKQQEQTNKASKSASKTKSKEQEELEAHFDELETLYNMGQLTEEQYHRKRLILLENYKGEWDKTTSNWLKSEREWCAEHNVTTSEFIDNMYFFVKELGERTNALFTTFTEKFDSLLEDYQNGLITAEEYNKRYKELLSESGMAYGKSKAYSSDKLKEYVESIFEPINSEFESQISDIQSRMDSFSDGMQGALKDAFEIKTNRDIYDETIKGYDDKISELEKKKEKAIELYGEDSSYVMSLQSQIDNVYAQADRYKEKYDKSNVKDDEIVSINFTDKLAEDTKTLEEYNTALTKLSEREVIPDVREMIAGMSVDEGKAFVEYLNGLTDAELTNIQDQWVKKKEETEKLSAALYENEIDDTINAYEMKLNDAVMDLPETMHDAGLEAMQELGRGFDEGTHDTLESFGKNMYDIKNEAINIVNENWIKEMASKLYNSTNGLLSLFNESHEITIKPILDLSDITKKLPTLNQLSNAGFVISPTIRKVNAIASDYQDAKSQTQTVNNNNTATALSSIENKIDSGFESVVNTVNNADVKVVLDSGAISGMVNGMVGKLVISKTRGS